MGLLSSGTFGRPPSRKRPPRRYPRWRMLRRRRCPEIPCPISPPHSPARIEPCCPSRRHHHHHHPMSHMVPRSPDPLFSRLPHRSVNGAFSPPRSRSRRSTNNWDCLVSFLPGAGRPNCRLRRGLISTGLRCLVLWPDTILPPICIILRTLRTPRTLRRLVRLVPLIKSVDGRGSWLMWCLPSDIILPQPVLSSAPPLGLDRPPRPPSEEERGRGSWPWLEWYFRRYV